MVIDVIIETYLWDAHEEETQFGRQEDIKSSFCSRDVSMDIRATADDDMQVDNSARGEVSGINALLQELDPAAEKKSQENL